MKIQGSDDLTSKPIPGADTHTKVRLLQILWCLTIDKRGGGIGNALFHACFTFL